MKGKQIKVIEYNLTFGSNARMVNILGLFKYKPNNNLYIVYSDVVSKYSIIYYGSSHIKETSILSMETKDPKDEEIIKEYIYKTTNNESLDNYDLINLDKIDGIEIISKNKIEIKKETLDRLISLTIPKKEENQEEKVKPKKKNPLKTIAVIIMFALIIGTGYYLYNNYSPKETISKQIICKKKYNDDELNVIIDEEQTFNFNINDKLEKVEITKIYKFDNETEYLEFINTGTYYKYMPEDNIEGGWDKNDEEQTFKTIEIERIDIGYKKPTEYEEVLSYYKIDEYNCEEKIIE